MGAEQSGTVGASQPLLQRMELEYCKRCGTLHVHVAGEAAAVCGTYSQTLRWIYTGGGK